MRNSEPFIAFFGGPAGAGKSTLARRWAEAQPSAVHIEHDEIGNLICSGKSDFQSGTVLVEQQVKAVSKACSLLGRSFFESGFSVAIDHVFYPGEFEKDWEPYLTGCRCAFVIVRPDLKTTLDRGSSRKKQVLEGIVRDQHEKTGSWPLDYVVDTTELSIEESFEKVSSVLDKMVVTISAF